MTILDVVQSASPKMGIARPSQLIADTGATSLEVQATLSEVAQMIRDRYDWSDYKTLGTFVGDGVALSFSKPSDYSRMLKEASLWPSGTPYSPLTHYTDSNEWLGVLTQNFQPVVGAWTLLGGLFQIRMGGNNAPLALADTVQFYYITKNLFADNMGAVKSAITADSDVFRIDERLLKLALIYKWKADKGRPYAQDLSDFEDALSVAVGNDKGSKVLTVGRGRWPRGLEIALPWPVVGP